MRNGVISFFLIYPKVVPFSDCCVAMLPYIPGLWYQIAWTAKCDFPELFLFPAGRSKYGEVASELGMHHGNLAQCVAEADAG